MTQRVLLTGGRAPATLDLARFFHDAGWGVFVAESCQFPLVKASLAITKTFQVPGPRGNRQDFIKELSSIVQANNIDLLVPTCEEVFYISQAKGELSSQCQVFTDDFDKLTNLHNKWEFSQLVQSFKIIAPETYRIQSSEELESWQDICQNWVFKPVFSRFATHTKICPKPEELKSIIPTIQQPWIAQQYISGTEYSTYAIVQKGIVQAHVTYHSKYRAGRGAGIYFEAVQQPKTLAFTQEFVKKIDYTGQIAFDFIQTLEGALYVLECNPRATSGIHLFSTEDNLPVAFSLNNTQVISPSTASKKMLGFVMPLYAWHSGYPLHVIIGDMFIASDVVFSWRDPLPFFYQVFSFAEMLWKSFLLKINLMQAATHELEWDGN